MDVFFYFDPENAVIYPLNLNTKWSVESF